MKTTMQLDMYDVKEKLYEEFYSINKVTVDDNWVIREKNSNSYICFGESSIDEITESDHTITIISKHTHIVLYKDAKLVTIYILNIY